MGRKKILLLLIVVMTVLAAGCLNEKGNPLPNEKAPDRTALQQTNPKSVAEEFIRAQANNNRTTMNKLMTTELKNSFQEKDLYLFNNEALKGKEVVLNNIKLMEENTEKDNAKLYTVDYELTLTEDTLKDVRQVTDLVFVTKNIESGKWFVSTYQHVLLQ
ncbi:hypothetical protein MFMK1_000628 [Metallumcola ferriviriculae]|uniref:Lipoprotein n=1 Tax=Metallumcola ferriviriculae TaxID=3039180 RepID=A0AAU0UJQ1_9FIRM|nr:hypothetical protein MFMK1_000628 [Desulfitibacteraceae bacterium MK1]